MVDLLSSYLFLISSSIFFFSILSFSYTWWKKVCEDLNERLSCNSMSTFRKHSISYLSIVPLLSKSINSKISSTWSLDNSSRGSVICCKYNMHSSFSMKPLLSISNRIQIFSTSDSIRISFDKSVSNFYCFWSINLKRGPWLTTF